ncbi:MAG: hypothetical protein E5Y31_02335 [Mesorhizobium sp.]|nr:MAG: hypothetical protein E5Y31_02335 [Mesorhizobium sp.]
MPNADEGRKARQHDRDRQDIEDAAAAVGVTIGSATDKHVVTVPNHGFSFYATRKGWIYARARDGSFEAPTSKLHRKRTGQALAANDCLDELSKSGVETFPSAAAAIRTTLKNYLIEAGPVRKLSDFEREGR